jgi:hypothetical protein
MWTAGARGYKSPAELVYLLSKVGAYGVNFHDADNPRLLVRK